MASISLIVLMKLRIRRYDRGPFGHTSNNREIFPQFHVEFTFNGMLDFKHMLLNNETVRANDSPAILIRVALQSAN